jgi:predicted HAD superfamily Cof-like phosphohydrolase
MNDWQDPETPIYNELMRRRAIVPSESPIYDQLLAEYQAQDKLLEEDEVNKMQQAVQEFHEAVGLTSNEAPRIPSAADIQLRIALMQEELTGPGELVDSMVKQDLIGIADGLADLLYVVFGTAVTYGIDIQPIFDEVHRSNMSKLDDNGKPIVSDGTDGFPAGKVLKGPNYSPPQIGELLNEQTTYGHADTTVYKTREIPITLGIGGPRIGQGKIVMEHNGEMMMEGVMDDVSTLPVIDHLGFSVSGLSIGPDLPEGEIPVSFIEEEPIEDVNAVAIKADGGPSSPMIGRSIDVVSKYPGIKSLAEGNLELGKLPEHFKAALGPFQTKDTIHISAAGPIEQNSFEVVFPPYDR